MDVCIIQLKYRSALIRVVLVPSGCVSLLPGVTNTKRGQANGSLVANHSP